MGVEWKKDVDAALTEAKAGNKPLLLDFSAAPAWSGCVRLEAESYEDDATSTFINKEFIPVTAHIKEHAANFHRFDVLWTPTVLILDSSNGRERLRLEGYLPNIEFRAWLKMGLARIAFMQKKWAEAEQRYADVVESYPHTHSAPEALYWRGVCRYKATNDHTVLGEVANELQQRYPDSVWTLKASIWSH
jgi:thioredoxin family protein/tetratricopeptide repeat protein